MFTVTQPCCIEDEGWLYTPCGLSSKTHGCIAVQQSLVVGVTDATSGHHSNSQYEQYRHLIYRSISLCHCRICSRHRLQSFTAYRRPTSLYVWDQWLVLNPCYSLNVSIKLWTLNRRWAQWPEVSIVCNKTPLKTRRNQARIDKKHLRNMGPCSLYFRIG